ncbi:pyridoxal phosphate-dependent aminotransferase [Paracoccus sp. MBLB3053]|uniref:aspartate transaminase n=1 Tax=Paracoccus aurantius TaxID=3073814 RepID=A0ABU2HWC1_9RHOB|nr:pyridoxal phosphate-dependent aminotransferase [Paracoccus sp. MBLB3053]MDS9469326.1 pyridoxal phosphate-dependent aminotransferase [Paracoccus sp. MBLB3053]
MRYASVTERLKDLGSGKWTLHMRGREMAGQGLPVIELTIGEPDLPPDPRLIDACERALQNGRVRYSNGRGETSVIDALAAKYSRRSGREVSRGNVLCFPGTQTALSVVLAGLVEAGDKVLVPDPYYATYEAVIRAPGAEVAPVKLRKDQRFHLRAEDLEAAITADCRALLLNNPHNPTGAVLSRDEIAAIGEICRKHDLWIISDEVYEQLVFDGEFVSPFDLPELADRTIVTSSISKSHAAPGFRSGWAIGPTEFCDRLLPLSESMLFGGQPFIADMTAFALSNDLPTARMMCEQYSRRAGLVVEMLAGVEGLEPLTPDAGMFILIDVAGTSLSGEEFASRLLEEQLVSVMPGASFGVEAASYIRLSLTVPDERLAEACDRIAHFASVLAGRGEIRRNETEQSLHSA